MIGFQLGREFRQTIVKNIRAWVVVTVDGEVVARRTNCKRATKGRLD